MRWSFRRRIGAYLFLLACSVPCAESPARAASLEAFGGAIAGSSSCTTFMTAPPIANFFGGGQGFLVGTTGNGISDCGLQGGFQDVTQATGPLSSPLEALSGVPVAGGTFTGSASGTASYGSVGASANVQFTGITGPGVFSSGFFAFQYGVPFEIKAGLLVQALPDTSGNVTGSMTAALTGINVSGETNFSALGSSGTSYPVPEPSTVVLLSAGLVALLLRRRAA